MTCLFADTLTIVREISYMQRQGIYVHVPCHTDHMLDYVCLHCSCELIYVFEKIHDFRLCIISNMSNYLLKDNK